MVVVVVVVVVDTCIGADVQMFWEMQRIEWNAILCGSVVLGMFVCFTLLTRLWMSCIGMQGLMGLMDFMY